MRDADVVSALLGGGLALFALLAAWVDRPRRVLPAVAVLGALSALASAELLSLGPLLEAIWHPTLVLVPLALVGLPWLWARAHPPRERSRLSALWSGALGLSMWGRWPALHAPEDDEARTSARWAAAVHATAIASPCGGLAQAMATMQEPTYLLWGPLAAAPVLWLALRTPLPKVEGPPRVALGPSAAWAGGLLVLGAFALVAGAPWFVGRGLLWVHHTLGSLGIVGAGAASALLGEPALLALVALRGTDLAVGAPPGLATALALGLTALPGPALWRSLRARGALRAFAPWAGLQLVVSATVAWLAGWTG